MIMEEWYAGFPDHDYQSLQKERAAGRTLLDKPAVAPKWLPARLLVRPAALLELYVAHGKNVQQRPGKRRSLGHSGGKYKPSSSHPDSMKERSTW